MKGAKILAIALASCVCPSIIWAAAWNKTASGTYSWNDTANWTNGVLPTVDTKAEFINAYPMAAGGQQTITGDAEVLNIDIITGSAGSEAVRRFTGNLAAKSLISRTGTNEIAGTLTLSGLSTGDGYYSRVGTAMETGALASVLDIVSGGSFLAEGSHAVYVGRHNDANSRVSGRIRVRDGATFKLSSSAVSSNSGLFLGRSSGSSTAPWFASSYVQDGGRAAIGRFFAGYERNANASITVSGGVLELNHVQDDKTRFIVGSLGYGIFQQLGGAVYVNTNKVQVTLDSGNNFPYAFMVGNGQTTASGFTNACFYVCNGAFVNGHSFLIHGGSSVNAGVMPAYATIDGNAAVTSTVVRVGANASDGAAILNLNGGELVTKYIWGMNGRTGKSEINANGGTIVFPSDIPNTYEDQFKYINQVNVYEGGLTVRCGRDINFGTASVAVPLRTVSGLGLNRVTRGDRTGGVLPGCIYPPRIEISGGSGSNATVVALVDYDTNQATNFVVTCRGEGYKAGDAVKALINRANESNPLLDGSVDVFLSANAPGALVKTGTGNLSLFAQPEFDGTYEVREGRLIQTTATTGSEKVAAVVVGGENAVFQCGTADSTATVANGNPVNPSATLTLGTANGPGTLAIPAAADGESVAFEQAFASLTVAGAGNAIEMAPGNAVANGAKVTFGTIICPDGAELTIPRWDSPLKVYVTSRPGHSVLRNIHFAGTDTRVGVGEDGQLVPAPGFFITFR